MKKKSKKKILLTFDVEDFINEESMFSLYKILILLRKHGFKGIFFITGNVAEKINRYPQIVRMLKAHVIGYHSSSHSVKPRIFEYTDLKQYEEAIKLSRERETSHINPLTGEAEGEGGLLFLRKLFPNKNINSFRAPIFCWTPPHLEALRELGIKFDFSTDLSQTPVCFKGINFYPYPIMLDSIKNFIAFMSIVKAYCRNVHSILRLRLLVIHLLKKNCIVLLIHPAGIFFKAWDHFYLQKNAPSEILSSNPRSGIEVKFRFAMLELLFLALSFVRRIGLIEVTHASRAQSNMRLRPGKKVAERAFSLVTREAMELFGYKPKYLKHHFRKFFEDS